jgi:hypothetical protein
VAGGFFFVCFPCLLFLPPPVLSPFLFCFGFSSISAGGGVVSIVAQGVSRGSDEKGKR